MARTSPERHGCDVIVLGAGAAGLMAAAVAGGRGRRVVVLEHNRDPGRKILISGGGRANFTNLNCAPDRFLSENPHFARSALALYEPRHLLEQVDRYRIPWHEKTPGQLFCDRSARDLLDMLLAECGRAGVRLVFNAQGIEVERDAGGFSVDSTEGGLRAGALVVATGGLSIPRLGATGLAFDLARRFGLGVVEPRPALVPLVLGGAEREWTELAGVATGVIAGAGRAQFRDRLLVTHRGLSGPAVLDASSYWRPGEPLTVDLAPGVDLLGELTGSGLHRDAAALRRTLGAVLPQRMAALLAERYGPGGWSNAVLGEYERRLHRFAFHPTGTEGFAKAEVTAGGVSTADLNARTLEARAVPGLYFVGEAVDVTGHLGGFNFQWAWASAVAAGRAL